MNNNNISEKCFKKNLKKLQDYCLDFYGEKLKIGDEVIPILDEALFIGIAGIISKIEYSEKYDNYYLTIIDKEGNILLEGVDARCYTTQTRYDEREKQEYVYDLAFLDENLWVKSTIPLTNKTDLDYEIPENIAFIILNAKHLESEKQWGNSYRVYPIYCFILKNCDSLIYKKTDNDFYLINKKTGAYYPIYGNYKLFENKDELKQYLKRVIAYFRTSSYVNDINKYSDNETTVAFEKILVRHLENI